MTKVEPHPCYFCGNYVLYGYEAAKPDERHWLSDCRPDLVRHEIGELCTWPGRSAEDYAPRMRCYGYQSDYEGRPWTTEHIHFYTDGPM